MRVQCVLNVALTDHTEVADHIHSRRAQHVKVFVRQRLARRHDNRVARVHTQRVQVLHIAHRDAIVAAVTHDLILDLLPAAHTLLDQHLRAVSKGRVAQLAQLVLVLRKARAQTTEGKGRTHNHRETDRARSLQRLVPVVRTRTRCTVLVDLFHRLGKQVAVLGLENRLDRCTEVPDAQLLKLVFQLDTDVQGRLTTERAINTIRTLVLQYFEHKLRRHGQKVHLVGKTRRRLDRRDVRVDQDRVNALLLEGLDRLRATVVKLTRLADTQTTTAQHQHLFGTQTLEARLVVLATTAGERHRASRLRTPNRGVVHHRAHKHIEQELGVAWTRRAFWMELHTEERRRLAVDTLVAVVIRIHKQLSPVGRQRRCINSIAVVLRRDITATRKLVRAGNVLATIAVLHLGCARAGSQGQDLVTKTDTKHGDHIRLPRDQRTDALDRRHAVCGITRTIREEQTVIRLGLRQDIMVKRHNFEFHTT